MTFSVSGMLSCTASNVPMLSDMSEVCVKAQSPACPWEVYICRELSHRLSNLDDWFERDLVCIRLPRRCRAHFLYPTLQMLFRHSDSVMVWHYVTVFSCVTGA